MPDRRYLVPGLVAGLLTVAVIVVIWLFVRHGAPVDAFAGFLGSLLGAAIAVVGAVWVNDRTAKLQEERETKILRKALLKLRLEVSTALRFYPDEGRPWCDRFKNSTREFCKLVTKTIIIVEQAQRSSRELDFIHLKALFELLPILKYAERWCADAFSEREPDPQDERDWRHILNTTKAAIDEAIPELYAH